MGTILSENLRLRVDFADSCMNLVSSWHAFRDLAPEDLFQGVTIAVGS